MKWTLQASACLVAMLLAGCNGNRNKGNETGSTSDTSRMSSDTGAMPSTGGMPAESARTDTSRSDTTRSDTGMSRDSARQSSRMHSDSTAENQSQSGVTNSKTGESTIGQNAEKTRPDQGQPVTSKGDTINPGVDSAR